VRDLVEAERFCAGMLGLEVLSKPDLGFSRTLASGG